MKEFSRRSLFKRAAVAGAALALPKDWLDAIPSAEVLGGPVPRVHSAALAYRGTQVTEWKAIPGAYVRDRVLYGDDVTWVARTLAFDEVWINVAGIGRFESDPGGRFDVVAGDATVVWAGTGIVSFG